jgi:hypothetical protein
MRGGLTDPLRDCAEDLLSQEVARDALCGGAFQSAKMASLSLRALTGNICWLFRIGFGTISQSATGVSASQ